MEHILSYKGDVYRLDNNLTLSLAREEKIVYTQPLITHKVNIFSADIDASGCIHIAAVLAGTLTYIKYENKKASTTHLMRLPDNFSITSLIINCEASLRLNYCVKSKEGCAIIEYTKNGESWQGKNIYTCQEDMLLKYVKKNKNEVHGIRFVVLIFIITSLVICFYVNFNYLIVLTLFLQLLFDIVPTNYKTYS